MTSIESYKLHLNANVAFLACSLDVYVLVR